MPVNDELGKRMKENYENVAKTRLMRRTPVAIRIDGKAFHTFTKGFQKPFDEVLIKSMQQTMQYLCENIQGCVFGYTQSDEITLILVDYKKLTSSAWFDYEVQKVCSIAASMATMAFNKYFYQEVLEWYSKMKPTTLADEQAIVAQVQVYKKAAETGAMFDARCFNIPKEEVTNLIYWRQLDATRNSIQMVGQTYFSHAQLEGKNQNDIQEMLWQNCGINWNDFPTHQKRGSCVVKNEIPVKSCGDGRVVAKLRDYSALPNEWIIDTEIPIFKGDGREYIEQLVYYQEE